MDTTDPAMYQPFFQYVLPALIGGVGGAIGSVFAPWANWKIEKKRQQMVRQQELITKWRKLIKEVTAILFKGYVSNGVNTRPIMMLLESQEDFYSLKTHLSSETISALNCPYNVTSDSIMNSALSKVVDEIGRLEKKWGLV